LHFIKSDFLLIAFKYIFRQTKRKFLTITCQNIENKFTLKPLNFIERK